MNRKLFLMSQLEAIAKTNNNGHLTILRLQPTGGTDLEQWLSERIWRSLLKA